MLTLARHGFLGVLTLSLVLSGCGDDEPALTACIEVCVSEDGTLVTCGVEYDFEALSAALQGRPELVEQLVFREVTTCQQAAFVSHVLD
jgi:hypothetical protein